MGIDTTEIDHLIAAVGASRSIFQSAAWIKTLIETAPLASNINAHLLADEGAGYFLGIEVGRTPKAIGPRRAWFNESGNTSLDGVYPEYNGLLGRTSNVSVNQSDRAIMACLDSLSADYPDIDEFVFRNMVDGFAETAKAFAETRDLAFVPFVEQQTYVIDLAALRDQDISHVESVGRSTRAKIRKSIRHFEEAGPLKIERADSFEARRSFFSELIDLHNQVWRSRGQEGAFDADLVKSFHHRFTERYPLHSDLFRITSGENVVGMLYNFREGLRAYNYQSGFSYEGVSGLVPGYVCHSLAADYYAKEGLQTYDLLGGGDHYKERLAKPGERLISFSLARKNWRWRLLSGVKNVKSALKRSS
ncbi:MAG: GNAT family N-acetyltransferase [Pseudomonadota bacterium]